MQLRTFTQSFPDAKLTKYIIQLILIRNLPGYLAGIVETAADVRGQQVTREFAIRSGSDIIRSLVSYFDQHMRPGLILSSGGRIPGWVTFIIYLEVPVSEIHPHNVYGFAGYRNAGVG